MQPPSTLLGTLGLDDRQCTELEIKRAYRKFCLVHHPDKATSENADVFLSIKDAFESLMGPDQSMPPPTMEIVGCVRGMRRHGKKMLFAYLVEEAEEVARQVLFDAELFDHEASQSAFPFSKTNIVPGDRLRCTVLAQEAPHRAGFHLCVSSWHRDRAEGTPPPTLSASARWRATTERRVGKSATAGWVRCPLCDTSSMKRYHRGDGLESHLNSKHAVDYDAATHGHAEWHTKMAALADELGISARRSAGVACDAAAALADEDGTSGGGARSGHRLSSRQPGHLLALEEPGSAGPGLAHSHPCLVAARDGDLAALQALVSGGEWRLFAPASLDRHGASALDWAAGGGHLECVQLLAPLALGQRACRRDGRGPLHWAARHGREETLRYLLGLPDLGSDPDLRTTNGTTMLMLACFGAHLTTADVLLDARASLTATNAWDCDCGHFAAMGGSVAACDWCARRGLSLTRRQRNGHTALHKAAERGQRAACAWLLARLDGAQRKRLADGAEQEPVKQQEDVEAQASPAPRRVEWTTPSGGVLTPAQLEERRRAGLPSSLARKMGHAACAETLAEGGV